jgi:hypothetical protein
MAISEIPATTVTEVSRLSSKGIATKMRTHESS